jgi:hypothetical protein
MNKEFIHESKKAMAIFMLLLSCLAYGQGGWMRKYDFGMPSSVICGILPDSNFYWISGIAVDTNQLPLVVSGSFVGRMDEFGNILSFNYILKQDTSIGAWNKGLKKINNDSLEVFCESRVFSEGVLIGGKLTYHINTNELNYKLLPIDTNLNFSYPKDFFQIGNLYFVESSVKLNGVFVGGDQFIRNRFLTYDLGLNELDYVQFSGQYDSVARNELCNMFQINDSTLLLGYNTVTFNNGPSLAKTILKKVDIQGNVLWSYESPVSAKEGVIAHLHQNPDKSIVYAVNAFVDQYYAGGQCCFYTYRGRVVKIDTLGNRLWERDWGSGRFSDDYPFQAMLVNEDESIISVGTQYFINTPQDTIYGGERGYITKTSSNGDSLWARSYIIRNQLNHWHNFMDIEATNDGGYILCGRSAINGPVFPDEQFTAMAWIVKTDSMGCVVPGCHLVGVDEEKKQRPKVLVYPNPARDYLAVFVPVSMSTQPLQIQLLNLEGKVVLEDQFTQRDATYLLELKNISAGLYVLKVLQNGEVVQAEKVIVE